jgi:type I restriction enzyme S subunit
MSKWAIKSLGDLVTLETGYPFKSKFFTNNVEDIPLVKGSNLQQGYIDWDNAKRWPKEEFDNYQKYKLKLDDVVLAMDRPWVSAGLKYSWIKKDDPKSLLVQRIALLRTKGEIEQRFLRYVISSQRFTDYIKPIVTGVNVPHISPDQIKSYKFELPPFDIQLKIVSILSDYDDLIENNTRRIAILEEMARLIYREWFVHFRYPGHENDKMADSGTDFGMIPEGWKVKELGDVVEIIRGKSYRSKDLLEEGGLPFVNLKCFERGGGFRKSGIKRFDGSYKEAQKVTKGDIVMAVTDMTQAREIIARAAMVPNLEEPFGIMSMDLVKIEPQKQNKFFIYSQLRHSSFPDEVKNFANGANVLHLSPKKIVDYPFIIPSNNIIDEYSSIQANLFNQKDTLERQSQKLKEMRDLLLPKLISGEVEV